MEKVSVEEILLRLKKGLSVSSDIQLAEKLGVANTTLSNWKSRGSMDFEKVFMVCDDLSIDWVIYGRGPMRIDDLRIAAHEDNSSQSIGYQNCNEMPISRDSASLERFARDLLETVKSQAIEVGKLRERLSRK